MRLAIFPEDPARPTQLRKVNEDRNDEFEALGKYFAAPLFKRIPALRLRRRKRRAEEF